MLLKQIRILCVDILCCFLSHARHVVYQRLLGRLLEAELACLAEHASELRLVRRSLRFFRGACIQDLLVGSARKVLLCLCTPDFVDHQAKARASCLQRYVALFLARIQ